MGKLTLVETVHGVVVTVYQVKVSVDKIIDPGAKVPFPTSEVELLGSALQHFIIWPKKLVELCTRADELKEKANLTFQSTVQSANDELPLDDPNSLSIVSKKVYNLICKRKENIVMRMTRDIVGNIDYELQLERMEILRFLNMETVDISLIQCFIRGLYIDNHLESKTMYGFLDPNWIQPKLNTRDERIKYINDTMQNGTKSCYLAPYVLNGHWMLMAICPRLYEIYWFDSIGLKPRDDITDIIETCMKATSILSGKKSSRPPKSITCPCAIQSGTTECGYYVMKFMFEIISNNLLKGMDKALEQCGGLPYNQQEIDEVRNIWCQYLINEWTNMMLLY